MEKATGASIKQALGVSPDEEREAKRAVAKARRKSVRTIQAQRFLKICSNERTERGELM